MRARDDIRPERVRALLDFDPKTGVLVWRYRPLRSGEPLPGTDPRVGSLAAVDRRWNNRWAGKPTGGVAPDGYLYTRVGKHLYVCHRLAWVHYYGRWPLGEIDHANGNRADNRIANLREATSSQNARNRRMRSDNTSGAKGVCWCDERAEWHAYIGVQGRRGSHTIGFFARFEDAVAARQRVAREMFGAFANETEV